MSTRLLRTTAATTVAVLVTTLAGLAAPGSAGAAPVVGHVSAPRLLGAAPTTARVTAKVPASTTRSRLVSLNQGVFPRKAAGQRIDLNLFPDVHVTGLVDSTTSRRGSTSWSGRLTPSSIHSDLAGSFNAVRVQDTYVVNINTNHAVYEITRAGGGAYRVTEAGPPPRPTGTDAEVGHPSGRAARSTQDRADRAAVAGDGSTVDVLVVYTAAALAGAGTQAALNAQIQLGIDQTNQAFANSAIGTSVRLVGARQVSGDDSTSIDINLGRLQAPGDGYFDEAQGYREQLHADLVSLWTGGAAQSTCGYGYYAATPGSGADWGYSAVTADNCATTYLVFTHELGHNFGADHDAQSSLSPSTAPYARGFVDPAHQRISVMAYYDNCGNPCTRVPYFSNPHLAPGGAPIGTALADNARQLNGAFPAVAAFRQSQIYAGTPRITGTPAVKQSLTAVADDWTPAGLSFAYQWLANGRPVTGATASRLTLTSAQLGKTITVQVTASGGTYAHVSAVSAPSTKVVHRTVPFTTRLGGKPRVGKTLSVKARSSVKKAGFSYAWFRNGTRIKHQKKASYHLVKKDKGTKIYARVVAQRKGYSRTVHVTRKVRVR